MDFMNRGARNESANQQPATHSPAGNYTSTPKTSKAGKLKNGLPGGNLTKIGSMAFLLALTLLVAGAIFAMINYSGGSAEANNVDKTKYQAVFLNGGQVYFGKVSDLNNKFAKINDVFYLRVNQQVQPNGNNAANNDVSLVKLGCELHGPQDSMVVNREQIVFWENLKDDGQVVKAVGKFKEQYPNGQNCADQNSSATPTTDSAAPSTPAATTPKKN